MFLFPIKVLLADIEGRQFPQPLTPQLCEVSLTLQNHFSASCDEFCLLELHLRSAVKIWVSGSVSLGGLGRWVRLDSLGRSGAVPGHNFPPLTVGEPLGPHKMCYIAAYRTIHPPYIAALIPPTYAPLTRSESPFPSPDQRDSTYRRQLRFISLCRLRAGTAIHPWIGKEHQG